MEKVAPTPRGTGEARAPHPLSQMAGHRGRCELKNSQQETDQTVLTIAKALTKTTNCTFRAMEGHDQKKFPALRAGSVPALSR